VNNLCSVVNKAQNNLPLNIDQSGSLILPSTYLPAHSSLSSQRCTGVYVERILAAELVITANFSNPIWKATFLSKVGNNPTLGSIEALLKTI
jgi:hypothetical protein